MIKKTAIISNAIGVLWLSVGIVADGFTYDIIPVLLGYSFLAINLAALLGQDKGSNLISSVLRRRQLEEEARISELEGKISSRRAA